MKWISFLLYTGGEWKAAGRGGGELEVGAKAKD